MNLHTATLCFTIKMELISSGPNEEVEDICLKDGGKVICDQEGRSTSGHEGAHHEGI